MPACFMLDFPDGAMEQYDRVIDLMELGGRLPPGALFHTVGARASGGIRVVDVWESDAAFQAFADAKIRPMSAEVGLLPPQILRFEVAMVRDTGSPRSAIRLFQIVKLDLDADGFREADTEIVGGGAARIPAGAVFHVNGPLPEGGWIVADGWTSREKRDRFIAERVMPVFQRRGGTPPDIEEFDVHNTLEPAAPADDRRATILRALDEQDAAFNRGDSRGVAAIYAPDAIIHDQSVPEPISGRSGVEAFIGGYMKAFPDMSWERVGIEIDGSVGVEQWRASGTHHGDLPGLPATHREMSIEGCSVMHFGEDGLVHEEENYWDEAAMLRQLGAPAVAVPAS